MASRTARLAKSSTLRRELRVSLVGLSDKRRHQGPLGDRHGDRPVRPVGVTRAAEDHRVGVGTEGAGVAPDPDGR